MIVLDTIKAKGIGFAEDMLFNHHVSIGKEQGSQSIQELEKKLTALKAERGDME